MSPLCPCIVNAEDKNEALKMFWDGHDYPEGHPFRKPRLKMTYKINNIYKHE